MAVAAVTVGFRLGGLGSVALAAALQEKKEDGSGRWRRTAKKQKDTPPSQRRVIARCAKQAMPCTRGVQAALCERGGRVWREPRVCRGSFREKTDRDLNLKSIFFVPWSLL